MLNLLISLVLSSLTSAFALGGDFKINDTVEVLISAENEITLEFPTLDPKAEYALITHDVSQKSAWFFESTNEVEVFPTPITNLLSPAWGEFQALRSGWTEDGLFLAMQLVRVSDIEKSHSVFKSYTQDQYAIKGETIGVDKSGGQTNVRVRFPLAEILKQAEGKPEHAKAKIVLLYPGLTQDASTLTALELPLSKLEEIGDGTTCELFFIR